MSPTLRISATGFGLIAVCYGFARFAFGLFLPQIDGDLSLGPSLSGIISGGSFAGYCVAILASVILTERVGARAVAVGAAIVAAIGMAGIALAPSPLILTGAVVVAGSSTGLASPPMATAVAAVVRKSRQDLVNTVINAGTSAGVALTGPIALAIAGQWRLAFGAFAAVAVVLAIAAAVSLPASAGGKGAGGVPPMNGSILRLVSASFLMGAASTALWSFGGQLVSQQLDWGPTGTGILWTCIGAGGIAGAWAGTLVNRFGLAPVHWTFLGLMAVGILAVGSGIATPALALIGGALFGAAYMMLTGVYLVWGTHALPDRPATGLMIGFLTIAVGQTAGAPLFGFLMAGPGAGPAVICFAVVALLAGAFKARGAIDGMPA
ncbi:MFS transporter [Acidocella aminolytica]|uniref:Sugar efflux transporter n=1 Tax=Acidocella aminolytica 101 = DSM 11237 TaxID=1120923 RepID=A0A0D6PGX5_9PROT|nr:MFS transporter [Acidocella aminolytica]GAN80094.1 sugar efflux transporter [Acidocella aminolytica 101 = DSM 11237]GBQ43550.1 major facilitator superfamily transporter [Acidocella aminolytica 101 = DSM 11237]SHE68484.1 Predicted arabinose efflux permease, MFS family [Acidocella aminolytica 101 = DSM 11237]